MPSPIPQEHASRARDERRRHESKAAVTGSDGAPVGPTLLRLTGRKNWPRQVQDWYGSWRRSPQARLFASDVEWQALARGCYLVEMFYSSDVSPAVRVQTWNAVKQLESLLGATHTDRVRTHMKVKPPEPEVDKSTVVDYRAMLAG